MNRRDFIYAFVTAPLGAMLVKLFGNEVERDAIGNKGARDMSRFVRERLAYADKVMRSSDCDIAPIESRAGGWYCLEYEFRYILATKPTAWFSIRWSCEGEPTGKQLCKAHAKLWEAVRRHIAFGQRTFFIPGDLQTVNARSCNCTIPAGPECNCWPSNDDMRRAVRRAIASATQVKK